MKVPKTNGDSLWNRKPEKTKKRCRTAGCNINGLPLPGRTLEGYGLDNKTLQLFKLMWRDSMCKNYVTHINCWALWALE